MKAEWRVGLRNRRLFFLNTVIPLAFVAPIILSNAPPIHVTAILVVLFALFSTFGSSIPLIRDQESGLLKRYVMTGLNPGRLVLERTVGFVAIDFLQLIPAMLLIIFTYSSTLGSTLLFVVAVLLSLLAGNLVGVLAATIARSIAEGALFSSGIALYLVHLAGVFRVASGGSFWATLELWIPFRPLYIAVRGIVTGISPTDTMGLMALPIVATVGLVLVTYLRGQMLSISKKMNS